MSATKEPRLHRGPRFWSYPALWLGYWLEVFCPRQMDGLAAFALYGPRPAIDGTPRFGRPTFPWWWLALRLPDRDAYVTWRHPVWWLWRHSYLVSRINWFFTRLGFWDLDPAGYYDGGHWRLDFWRSARSWWQIRRRTLTVTAKKLDDDGQC